MRNKLAPSALQTAYILLIAGAGCAGYLISGVEVATVVKGVLIIVAVLGLLFGTLCAIFAGEEE